MKLNRREAARQRTPHCRRAKTLASRVPCIICRSTHITKPSFCLRQQSPTHSTPADWILSSHPDCIKRHCPSFTTRNSACLEKQTIGKFVDTINIDSSLSAEQVAPYSAPRIATFRDSIWSRLHMRKGTAMHGLATSILALAAQHHG